MRIGRTPDLTGNFFNGLIDEVRISKVARSADELLEATRGGRDHRLTRIIPSTNLSSSGKLPFYLAADRPGTYLEATIGNTSYSNYESDSNTIYLNHFDEQNIPRTCLSLKRDGYNTDGVYTIDPDGQGENRQYRPTVT